MTFDEYCVLSHKSQTLGQGGGELNDNFVSLSFDFFLIQSYIPVQTRSAAGFQTSLTRTKL